MSYIPDIGLQKYDYIVDMPNLYINKTDNMKVNEITIIPVIRADELLKKNPKSQKICLIPFIA